MQNNLKGARSINNLPESLVVKIWQHQWSAKQPLVTEQGEPIRIIYPGRLNDDRGADFRDAVIATRQGITKGDIEVHVKSSDWQAHQHHLNPAYNRVILHVVMWHDTEATTSLQSGEKAHILALYKHMKSPISQLSDYASATGGMPCLKAVADLTPDRIAEVLDSAGEERFLAKATRYEADLAQVGASQCLYQGIMAALGYSKNKTAFLELAYRLPVQILESITQDRVSDEECLAQQQALLLGTAGLLPSQRPNWHQRNNSDDKWIDKLERLWASSHQTKVMSLNDWHLFKVRPNNFPVRRIVAMSYLILRYKEKGVFEELVNMVGEIPVSTGHHRLEKGLTVRTNGYWANHFDFSLGSKENPTLLGNGRAVDIAVNVLLPFTFAWSRVNCQPELGRKALALYRSYPKLTINTVESHMRNQLGLSRRLVNSARRQQGLIHLYETLCTQGKCNCCPLGKAT